VRVCIFFLCVCGLIPQVLSQTRPGRDYVPDSSTAVTIAEAVLVPIYGKKQIESEEPFKAELKDGMWTVTGTLHCKDSKGNDAVFCPGGTAVVELSKSDARIISLRHYK
jgi:hypothetical protein